MPLTEITAAVAVVALIRKISLAVTGEIPRENAVSSSRLSTFNLHRKRNTIVIAIKVTGRIVRSSLHVILQSPPSSQNVISGN